MAVWDPSQGAFPTGGGGYYPGGNAPQGAAPTTPPPVDGAGTTMPSDQTQTGTIGGGETIGGPVPGTFGGPGGYTPAPSGYDPNVGYSPPSYGASGGGGGGGGSLVGGSSGGYAYGGGLQQYPAGGSTPSLFDPSNPSYGQFNNSTGAGSSGGARSLGGTTSGTPSYGQTGGGINPGGPGDWIGNATPYAGGPSSQFGNAGYQPGTPNQQNALTMSGFQQGGIGAAPQTAYNQYQSMVANPTSMTDNPAYQAIMNASLQATQRAALAHGGNGGGTQAAELAQTGAAVAGQYIPQMAQMYQGAAQQELGNWNTQQQTNLAAGQLGNNMYGTQGQVNLGQGNLANNMYQNTANNQFNRGIAYTNAQMQNANTGSAQLAYAQNQPANQYFQNQLTMSGMG